MNTNPAMAVLRPLAVKAIRDNKLLFDGIEAIRKDPVMKSLALSLVDQIRRATPMDVLDIAHSIFVIFAEAAYEELAK